MNSSANHCCATHTISFAQTATNNSCLFISICIKNFHLKCCFILKDKLKEKTQPPTIWKIDLFFLICVSYSLSHAIIFHTAANNAINATQITGREKKLYNRVSFTLHHRSIEHLFRTWINLKKVYWHWMLQPMHATSFPCGLIECSIGVRSRRNVIRHKWVGDWNVYLSFAIINWQIAPHTSAFRCVVFLKLIYLWLHRALYSDRHKKMLAWKCLNVGATYALCQMRYWNPKLTKTGAYACFLLSPIAWLLFLKSNFL